MKLIRNLKAFLIFLEEITIYCTNRIDISEVQAQNRNNLHVTELNGNQILNFKYKSKTGFGGGGAKQ